MRWTKRRPPAKEGVVVRKLGFWLVVALLILAVLLVPQVFALHF
jgi:hypothetical protein